MAKFNLKRFLQILQAVGPGVLLVVPGGAAFGALIPVVIHAIGEAQAIEGASGADKKAHVMEIVESAVETVNSTVGGKIKLDKVEVQNVVGKGIDTVISTIHVIEGAKVVKTPDPKVP